jgi:hypothetical protein
MSTAVAERTRDLVVRPPIVDHADLRHVVVDDFSEATLEGFVVGDDGVRREHGAE